MPRLFVEKNIEINASAKKVWDVLTMHELNKEWIKEWWPEMEILISDWKEGSLVQWKLKNGKIGAEGKVLEVEPYKILRFSFRADDPASLKEEIISYNLEELTKSTILAVSVGDFGNTPEHELCYPGAVKTWNKSLPKIKELAESL